jgi:hypothetical protein
MPGPRQAIYRLSSGGVEVRARVNLGKLWIVARARGTEARYFDIPKIRLLRSWANWKR